MIILGIDPGTARMGWGAIKIAKSKKQKVKSKDLELLGYGCVVTDKEDGVGKRLVILRRELKKIIVIHQPEVMVVERLFFGMNARTAISVGQATGVILLTANEHKIPIFEYTPGEVKSATAGSGSADKKQVATMLHILIKIEKKIKHDDEYDAIAVGITHLAHHRS